MRLRYNRDEDILLIETSPEGKITHAEHTGPLIAHFSEDQKLILLEILDASEFLACLLKTSITGEEQELLSPA